MRLSSHQRHQPHEADCRFEADLDLLVQALHLTVVHQEEEAVALEGLDGAGVLLLPVDLPT